jgi:hypothetical protein
VTENEAVPRASSTLASARSRYRLVYGLTISSKVLPSTLRWVRSFYIGGRACAPGAGVSSGLGSGADNEWNGIKTRPPS